MEERMACGEREDGNKSLEKWCKLEESIVRLTTYDGHNRHFTFQPVYRITSVIRRACIVVIFFAVDGAEALFLEQRCGVGDHRAVPTEIDGEMLDGCDPFFDQPQHTA